MTRYRLPLRTRLTDLWRRLTGRAIPYRDLWSQYELDLVEALRTICADDDDGCECSGCLSLRRFDGRPRRALA